MPSDDEIHIYVGCTEAQDLIAKVLSWSVLRRTQRAVRFHPLYAHAVGFEMPRDPQNRPGTPFSFHRFMIPEIAGYRGRAIYMDCDQIVFKDVARLHDWPMHGAPLLCCDTRNKRKPTPTKRSSMMLLDCARLDWQIQRIVQDLDAEHYSYQALFSLEGYPHTLPRAWNALDRYRWPWTALLHFTSKARQPWIHHRHALAYLWVKELFAALQANYITSDEVRAAAARQLVRPSLVHQMVHRLADPRALPEAVKAADEPFISACAARDFNNVPGEYRDPRVGTARQSARLG
ncbi:MAG: hypothetical protein L0H63_04450 [Nitrococcus sp.]|nr:hypothetical protein [Nitrococcus sp.]